MDTHINEGSQTRKEYPVFFLNSSTRAALSLAAQMSLDQGDIFTDDRYQAYAKMAETAEQKRDEFVRQLLILDCIIILLSLGQAIPVPGFGISLDKIPAAVEIALCLSGLAFYFSTMAFWTSQVYDIVFQQFNIKRLQYSGIDPEFLSGADRYINFSLKLARPRLNIWGNDFFFPGRGARVFFKFNAIALSVVLSYVPILHLTALWFGLSASAAKLEWPYFAVIAFIVVGLNLIAVGVAIGHGIDWKYQIAPYTPDLTRNPYLHPDHMPPEMAHPEATQNPTIPQPVGA